ncbi:hypothetical protein QA612_16560 [Evansella sp. AB-P1]|uniref:hypothetical protein n=1 Tax=Evansella sp. AB-P1 TaxID=3037653 RepID=UPI00241F6F1F|nr:hypothetical protein [Evansella sp. AB-P1]MDG5789071.1 hypothetical protein [Evansella sp. AB-P1]
MEWNKKKIDHDDLSDVVEQVEFEELEKELNQYLVKYPDEKMMDSTIDTLGQYVPSKRKKNIKYKERMQRLMKIIGTEISTVRKGYWVASVILFVMGYFITGYGAYNPVLTLAILAPVPFVFGLVEVFKGRENGVLEMEMTCKFSSYELMLFRLLIISVFNIILNSILTFAIVPYAEATSLLELVFIWFTPLTLFAAISLWLSIHFRGVVFISIFIPLWLLFSIVLINGSASWTNYLLNVNFLFHLSCMLIGLLLLVLQIKQLIRKYSTYEGGTTFEVNN